LGVDAAAAIVGDATAAGAGAGTSATDATDVGTALAAAAKRAS